MRSPKSVAGVTWKEALAAAVIVLLVGSILFPLPHGRGDNARRASCQSNMRQLGLAYVQYAQDNDDLFPRGHTLSGEGWAGQVYPYVKSTGVYHCPDDTVSDPHISYAENGRVVRKKMAAVVDPTLTVLLYEDTTPECDPSTGWETVSATGLNAPQDSTRHDETRFSLNFLFVDGHVKYLRPGVASSGLKPMTAQQIRQSGNGTYTATFAVK